MTNIKEVARRAGVSIKTVSRVINHSPEVASETRERVHRVIEALGYRPNLLARGLVNGKTNTVGVVIHHAAHEIFTYPVFSDALKGISKVLAENELDLLLNLAWAGRLYVDLFRQHRVDGLILMGIPLNDPQLEGLVESGAPFVSTCRLFENGPLTNWVDPDFYDGTVQIVDYLAGVGHRRIALIAGPPGLGSARIRERAFRATMAKHGLAVVPELIAYGPLFEGTGRRLAEELISRDPGLTAIICSDDMVALEAVERLQQLGYRVPADVSVVGCDDASLVRFATPSLTTIRQDGYQKGYLAAARLLELMAKGDDPPAPVQRLLPMQLILRDSTGPARR